MTIHTFEGGPGPTVGVSAAIHGDEPISVEIVRRLAGFLDQPDVELRGTVRLLPVANPLAFESNTRHTLVDHLNLNRLFPGDPDGWLTEQLAAKITISFLMGLDAYIDLHAGGAFPIVDYVYLSNAPELSRAFGSRLLFQPEAPYAGTSASEAEAKGIPTVTVEARRRSVRRRRVRPARTRRRAQCLANARCVVRSRETGTRASAHARIDDPAAARGRYPRSRGARERPRHRGQRRHGTRADLQPVTRLSC